MKFDGVAEPVAAYDADIDYQNEHRCAEHEHEVQAEENRTLAPCIGPLLLAWPLSRPRLFRVLHYSATAPRSGERS
jgi:hypothetical protein